MAQDDQNNLKTGSEINQKIEEAVSAIEKIAEETITAIKDLRLKKVTTLKEADIDSASLEIDKIRKKINKNN